jgi:hypothetical protein
MHTLEHTGIPHATDALVDDHARLHALLARAMAGPTLDAEAFAAFRKGLLRHIGIEEKVLFPAARRARGGEAVEGTRALRLEHAALTSLLVPTPDLALCAELAALLATHDAKEEGHDGVYAACERALSPAGRAETQEKIAAFPEVPVVAHFDGPGTFRTAADALAAAQRARSGAPS